MAQGKYVSGCLGLLPCASVARSDHIAARSRPLSPAAHPLDHVSLSGLSLFSHSCLFNLISQRDPPPATAACTCLRPSSPAEVLLRLQLLLAVAQTQEVALVDVQSHDLLEQLVQSLVVERESSQ